jgi:hypothetical protein
MSDKPLPWEISKCEARSLDFYFAHDCTRAAARAAGLGIRTIEAQLRSAYRKMRKHGVFGRGASRHQARVAWWRYWNDEVV